MLRHQTNVTDRSLSFRFHSEGAAEGPIPVGQWLSTDFKVRYFDKQHTIP